MVEISKAQSFDRHERIQKLRKMSLSFVVEKFDELAKRRAQIGFSLSDFCQDTQFPEFLWERWRQAALELEQKYPQEAAPRVLDMYDLEQGGNQGSKFLRLWWEKSKCSYALWFKRQPYVQELAWQFLKEILSVSDEKLEDRLRLTGDLLVILQSFKNPDFVDMVLDYGLFDHEELRYQVICILLDSGSDRALDFVNQKFRAHFRHLNEADGVGESILISFNDPEVTIDYDDHFWLAESIYGLGVKKKLTIDELFYIAERIDLPACTRSAALRALIELQSKDELSEHQEARFVDLVTRVVEWNAGARAGTFSGSIHCSFRDKFLPGKLIKNLKHSLVVSQDAYLRKEVLSLLIESQSLRFEEYLALIDNELRRLEKGVSRADSSEIMTIALWEMTQLAIESNDHDCCIRSITALGKVISTVKVPGPILLTAIFCRGRFLREGFELSKQERWSLNSVFETALGLLNMAPTRVDRKFLHKVCLALYFIGIVPDSVSSEQLAEWLKSIGTDGEFCAWIRQNCKTDDRFTCEFLEKEVLSIRRFDLDGLSVDKGSKLFNNLRGVGS
ncbi:MAG: hypothetical protein NZT61_01550 [Deltaproteobacteria bacterium]|nr:hypothetical protein [Deltaproteobacteria bacterium]